MSAELYMSWKLLHTAELRITTYSRATHTTNLHTSWKLLYKHFQDCKGNTTNGYLVCMKISSPETFIECYSMNEC